jgi:hypothetical protein
MAQTLDGFEVLHGFGGAQYTLGVTDVLRIERPNRRAAIRLQTSVRKDKRHP